MKMDMPTIKAYSSQTSGRKIVSHILGDILNNRFEYCNTNFGINSNQILIYYPIHFHYHSYYFILFYALKHRRIFIIKLAYFFKKDFHIPFCFTLQFANHIFIQKYERRYTSFLCLVMLRESIC